MRKLSLLILFILLCSSIAFAYEPPLRPPIVAECVESDGGRDIYSFGTCSDGTVSVEDRCLTDRDLVEYTCENNKCVNAAGGPGTLTCPINHICKEGACVPKTNELPGAPIPLVEPGSPIAPVVKKLEDCEGCLLKDSCILYGMRIDGEYCDIDKNIKIQKQVSETCNNNFECGSNTCSNDECIDLGRELQETRGLLERILAWLTNIF